MAERGNDDPDAVALGLESDEPGFRAWVEGVDSLSRDEAFKVAAERLHAARRRMVRGLRAFVEGPAGVSGPGGPVNRSAASWCSLARRATGGRQGPLRASRE